MNGIASPHYAVIFTSQLIQHSKEYEEMATKMEAFAKKQPGYLGLDSARTDIGITVSYWRSHEDIVRWKNHTEHLFAQHKGISDWYKWYTIRVCKVERSYEFKRPEPGNSV